VGYWTEGEPQTLAGFLRRFPDLTRFENADRLYEDPTIHLVVTAAIPDLRSGIAVRAMRHGMDVMVDKPGVVSLAQLREVERVQTETGRIWSVNYSERFEVRAMTRVNELIQAGAIGEVVHLTGFGPHRINRHLRPPWFFERARTGGILCDIASHQIDQFLHLTGAPDADVVAAAVANRTNPDYPGFEDYGEVLLRTERSTGFSRVDWYTPDGLPTWGDGRLMVVGTGGYIDLRKYVDIAGALEHGVRVALSTDWSPSGSFNMREEVVCARRVAEQAGAVLPGQALWRMATINGAYALGLEGRLGAIESGLRADLMLVRYAGGDAYEAVLTATDEDILATWIDGRAVLLSRLLDESLSGGGCEALDGVAPRVCGVFGAFGLSAERFGDYLEDTVPVNDVSGQAACSPSG